MKPITEPEWKNVPTAWGHHADVCYQYFEVEESDVDKIRHSYRGRNYQSYTFKRSDIGRKIQTLHSKNESPGAGCWVFSS